MLALGTRAFRWFLRALLALLSGLQHAHTVAAALGAHPLLLRVVLRLPLVPTAHAPEPRLLCHSYLHNGQPRIAQITANDFVFSYSIRADSRYSRLPLPFNSHGFTLFAVTPSIQFAQIRVIRGYLFSIRTDSRYSRLPLLNSHGFTLFAVTPSRPPSCTESPPA